MSRPMTPNNEPSVMATTVLDLDLGLGDKVALAIEEAIIGTGKVEVGNREEDVEELTFVTVV